jgi:AbrB family looped-hinge helix DNA binding protein
MGMLEKLTTRLSTKGQVILPKALRDHLRWEAGTKLTVEQTEDGVLLREVPLFKPTTIEQVRGMLAYKGKTKSLEDMDAGVLAEARRRARD